MRIACFQECCCGISRGREFVGHAARGVEYESDAQRQILNIEILDFLLDTVFGEPEVLPVQTGDQPAIQVGYGGIDQDKIDVDFERFVLGFRYPAVA